MKATERSSTPRLARQIYRRGFSMRVLFRLTIGAALLAAAMITTVAPAFAANTTDTIAVTCSNGFTRTVSANAARGVANSLTKFNAYNGKSTTMRGGTRRAPADSHSVADRELLEWFREDGQCQGCRSNRQGPERLFDAQEPWCDLFRCVS